MQATFFRPAATNCNGVANAHLDPMAVFGQIRDAIKAAGYTGPVNIRVTSDRGDEIAFDASAGEQKLTGTITPKGVSLVPA